VPPGPVPVSHGPSPIIGSLSYAGGAAPGRNGLPGKLPVLVTLRHTGPTVTAACCPRTGSLIPVSLSLSRRAERPPGPGPGDKPQLAAAARPRIGHGQDHPQACTQ
jgi:hypothetical protein